MCNPPLNDSSRRGSLQTAYEKMELAARLINEGSRIIESQSAKELAILKTYIKAADPSPELVEQVKSITGMTPLQLSTAHNNPTTRQMLASLQSPASRAQPRRNCGCGALRRLALDNQASPASTDSSWPEGSSQATFGDLQELCCLDESCSVPSTATASLASFPASSVEPHDWAHSLQQPLGVPDSTSQQQTPLYVFQQPQLPYPVANAQDIDTPGYPDSAFGDDLSTWLQDPSIQWPKSDAAMGIAGMQPGMPSLDQFNQFYDVQRNLPPHSNFALDPSLMSSDNPRRESTTELGAAKTAEEQRTDSVVASQDTSPQTDDSTDPPPGGGGKQKPVCWDHGCQGRQFSSWSNFRRHQRERAREGAQMCHCPRCGAAFTRTSGRDQHLANLSCSRIRRYSNGRIRPMTLRVQEALAKAS